MSNHLAQALGESLSSRLSAVMTVNQDPQHLADLCAAHALEYLLAVQVLTSQRVELFERDAKIYQLRTKGSRPCELGARFAMSRTRIFEAIRRHIKQRRAGLRLSA